MNVVTFNGAAKGLRFELSLELSMPKRGSGELSYTHGSATRPSQEPLWEPSDAN